MAKQKQSPFHIFWLVIPTILIILLGAFVIFKGSAKPEQSEDTSYRVYQNLDYGFSINYPAAWEMRNDIQSFENGDVVSFSITGSTQKPRTELTDGARLSIAVPFAIDSDLKTWLKKNHTDEAKFSQITFGGTTFEQVDECYIGCLTYFYTLKDGKVFGIAILAAGDDTIKMVYDNTLITMLKSFKFTDATKTTSSGLSEDAAIAKIKARADVKDYLIRVPKGLVAVNSEDDTNYMVQVYEIKDNHTATFNWYTVNKQTGEITAEFDF